VGGYNLRFKEDVWKSDAAGLMFDTYGNGGVGGAAVTGSRQVVAGMQTHVDISVGWVWPLSGVGVEYECSECEGGGLKSGCAVSTPTPLFPTVTASATPSPVPSASTYVCTDTICYELTLT